MEAFDPLYREYCTADLKRELLAAIAEDDVKTAEFVLQNGPLTDNMLKEAAAARAFDTLHLMMKYASPAERIEVMKRAIKAGDFELVALIIEEFDDRASLLRYAVKYTPDFRVLCVIWESGRLHFPEARGELMNMTSARIKKLSERAFNK